MAVSYTPAFTLTNGTTADATQVMANFNGVTTSLLGAAASGANSDITSLTGLTTPIPAGAAGGSTVYWGGTSTGTANAQVCVTPVPNGFAMTPGNRIVFIASATNTAAMQLNANAQGLQNFFVQTPAGPQAMIGGEVVSGCIVEAEVLTATQFVLVNTMAQFGGSGPLANLASAGTTDLGTIPSHNVNITGVATITAFGSTATTAFPIYRLTFAGSLVLTYNVTSMILVGGANITTQANDTAIAVYLGSGNWAVIQYVRAQLSPSAGAMPGANSLVITNNSAQQITVTTTGIVMVNSSGFPIYGTSSSFTINLTVNGVDGLDTGARGTSNWIYVYAISNGSAIHGLASLSAPSVGPSPLPAGYTYTAYLGACRNNAGGNLLGTIQKGNKASYILGSANLATLPQIVTGTVGSPLVPTWVAQSITTFVPTTATHINILATLASIVSSAAIVAPNNSYGASSSQTIPPPFVITNAAGTTLITSSVGEMLLESTSIYYASNAAGNAVYTRGWTDAVNAN